MKRAIEITLSDEDWKTYEREAKNRGISLEMMISESLEKLIDHKELIKLESQLDWKLEKATEVFNQIEQASSFTEANALKIEHAELMKQARDLQERADKIRFMD